MATVQLKEIPGGILGTSATIKQMQKLVLKAKIDPQILRLSAYIVNNAGTEARDHFGEARAIFCYLRQKVHYMWDPNGIELLVSPKQALARGAGDCDCLSTLFNALCESVGLRTVFVTIKANPLATNQYTHVYSRVFIPEKGAWISADLSAPYPFGWEHPLARDKSNIAIWKGSL